MNMEALARKHVAESPQSERMLQQWRIECQALALRTPDLPHSPEDALARFKALPPGAAMVYARGEHRGIAGADMLRLAERGLALLVQRRVGPVAAMCRDYIAIKVRG